MSHRPHPPGTPGIARFATALVAALALTGCALPVYEAPRDKPTARLEPNRAGLAWTCAGGKRQRLVAESDGHAVVPAGERITIGLSYYKSDGTWTQHCEPSMSFVPVAGHSYWMDFEMEAERCTDFVYLESKANRVGLELVPTLGPGEWCPAR